MLDLAGEGLIEVVRNKGFRVTELTEAELDAMAEVRMLIEPPVMGMVAAACEGAVAEAVEALRPLALEITAAARRGDLVSYIEADTDFHVRFLALHGNRHVVDQVRHLRSRSRLYGLEPMLGTGLMLTLCEEHEEMVDVALARDAKGMETLVARHIGHVRWSWAGRDPDGPAHSQPPHLPALPSATTAGMASRAATRRGSDDGLAGNT